MNVLARRYARAAVETLQEQKDDAGLVALVESLERFYAAFLVNEDLRQLLLNPTLADEREPVLEKVLGVMELSQTARRLIALLVRNERVKLLKAVVHEARELVDDLQGRVRARVVSAVQPSDEQTRRLTTSLEERVGRPVVLDIEVDPGILGGLVCHVGGVTLDNSVKRQLEILRERL